MKFIRTNYLQPFRVYRNHYCKISLRYEYDFGGPTFLVDVGSLPFINSFLAKGEFDISWEEPSTGVLLIHIAGRFWQTNQAPLPIVITLPGATFSGEDVIEDPIPVVVENEYFWSKNPIRIPIRSIPAEPIGLFAETYYQSGDFRKIADIVVTDLGESPFLDLQEYLDSWLERSSWKDFASFHSTDAAGIYKHNLRRFHIGHNASFISDLDTNPFQPYNTWTVVQGGQEKALFARAQSKWGLPSETAGWFAPGLKISSPTTPDFKGVYSAFALNGENRIPVPTLMAEAEEELFLESHPGESIVRVRISTLYSFVLAHDAKGTVLYFSEKDYLHYRVCNRFEGVFAVDFRVKEDGAPDSPIIWMFVDSPTNPLIYNFPAGIFDSLSESDLLILKVEMPSLDSTPWNWVCTCDRNAGGVAGLIGRAGFQHCLVIFPTAANVVFEEAKIFYATMLISAICNPVDSSTYVYVEHSNGVYKSTDEGSSWFAMSALNSGRATTTVEFIRLDDNNWICACWSFSPDSNLFLENADLNYDSISSSINTGAISFYGGYYLSGSKLFVATNYNFTEHPTPYSLSTGSMITTTFDLPYEKRFAAGGTPERIRTIGQNTGTSWAVCSSVSADEILLPQAFWLGYIKKLVLGTGEPFSLIFKNKAGNAAISYDYDGRYFRHQRILIFRNMAGAYDILLLSGTSETSFSAKKQMGIRYVQDGSELQRGEQFQSWIDDAQEVTRVSSSYMNKNAYRYYYRELVLSKEAYLIDIGSDPVPVVVNLQKSIPVRDNPELYLIEMDLEKSFQLI